MRFGGFHLDLVDGGVERVAGEKIFGVVPKPLWQRRFPPDAEGRVRVARRALLVRAAGFTALAAGAPGDYGRKDRLADRVDALILSRLEAGGSADAMAARFRNAAVHVPSAGDRADRVIYPGLTVLSLPDGSLGLRIDSEGRTAAYLGDALPTAEHVPTAWLVAGESYPVELIQGKKALVDRAVREGWLCVFWRDPDVPWGVIVDEASGKRRVHVASARS